MKDRTSNSIGTIDWEDINWKVVNTQVQKLRKRIFKATKQAQMGLGRWNTVRSLMKLLMKSFNTLLLAVRKVTYLNQGKETAGIDGYKAITTKARKSLIEKWEWNEVEAIPSKRVYIPKANGKKRPLGIPSITDRIAQAIMLLAYEPLFETSFEPTSYGFRPGRSCNDAIQDIFANTRKGSTNHWVLDADIKGAFDNISHEFIMYKIKNLPGRNIILRWLKSGYMEKGKFFPTHSGTPQGGIISPLLANIALDGLHDLLTQHEGKYTYVTTGIRGKLCNVTRTIPKYNFLRYADDFIILSHKKEWLEEILPTIKEWLKKRGLELNEEKTKIKNIKEEGFSFLGFDIRQHKNTTMRRGSNRFFREIKKRGGKKPISREKIETIYSAYIKPGKEEVKRFLKEIRTFIKKNGTIMGWENLINTLNSKIRGWGMYYRYFVSKQTFTKVNSEIRNAIYRMLRRKHPQKSNKWIRRKYYTTIDADHFVPYGTKRDRKGKTRKLWLINLGKDIPILRFTKVKGNNSPLDPEQSQYWIKRKYEKGKHRFALLKQIPENLQ